MCRLGLNNGRTPVCVPAAHMSSGPVGGGGDNLKYALLVGAVSVGGLVYVSEPDYHQEVLVIVF